MTHEFITTPIIVEVAVAGQIYRGTYTVGRDVIRVRTAYGEKTTQLGPMPPAVLARLLLRELVDEGKA